MKASPIFIAALAAVTANAASSANPNSASVSVTGVMSIPEGTSLGTASRPGTMVTNTIRTSTGVAGSGTETDACTPFTTPSRASTTTGGTPTTSKQATSSTAGAAMNRAAGVLAAAGLVAACFM